MSDIRALDSIPSISDEDLKQFVIDAVEGKLFVLQQLGEDNGHLAVMVFMPLIGVALTDEARADLGTIWERFDKAEPRAINGFPSFFSMNLMNKADWSRARHAIVNLQARREQEQKDLKV